MIDLNHRSPNEKINTLIDDGLIAERSKQPTRTYLGGSRLGVSCERALQFEFFNAQKDDGKNFSGRTLRIFDVGSYLEDLAVNWIQTAGFTLYTRNPDTGSQYGFSVANGRIAGHVDGVIVNGPPDVIEYPALWECKTMSAKHWRDCVKNGVAKSKPVSAAKIAIYQKYLCLTQNPAIFTAINKDTEELWFEPVPYNAALAQSSIEKGFRVLKACDEGIALPRIANSPDYLECKWCSWSARCWAMPYA